MSSLKTPHPQASSPPRGEEGQNQLRLYRYTFQSVFNDWPDWEKHYPEVTYKLKHIKSPDDLFRKTFDALCVIRDTP